MSSLKLVKMDIKFIALYFFFVLGLFAQQSFSAESIAKPQTANRPVTSSLSANISDCGSLDDLAKRVEVCAKPLMDILQGTVEKWPRNEAETLELCNSFIASEKCIRENGRKCAKGLHKTILSTLATSVQRARKRECTTPKLAGVLKTTQCVEKNQKIVHDLMANITSRLVVIEDQMKDLDVKTTAVCCMVHDIEKEIKQTLNPKCPNEAAIVVRLYRAVLEDVIELICSKPTCNDIFRGYKIKKLDDGFGIIAILLRIVFSLG